MSDRIPPLAGYRVAVTADRRAEEQVTLLERRGAEVLVGATVRTVPLVDGEQLSHAIDSLIAVPADVLVLLTGIGTRGLLAAAESTGRDVALLDALATSTVIARGPKAAGAATTAGLDVGWLAQSERSSEILDHLTDRARAGARIAVQRDGREQPELVTALRELGADTVDVPVYRWELPHDVRPAMRLVDAVIDGEVDAVTFTSSPALRHLLELAASSGRRDAVLDALAGPVVMVCVGPVCEETARDAGIERVVTPRRARLGAMVQALVAHFDGTSRTIATAAGEVTMQGRAVYVDGAAAPLTSREREVLDALAGAGGAVVPKARLLRTVWGSTAAEEHAVEVTVARLRRGLGPIGAAVETVPRRGYRLAMTSR
jgi:uroporphyrinogen-III synthase